VKNGKDLPIPNQPRPQRQGTNSLEPSSKLLCRDVAQASGECGSFPRAAEQVGRLTGPIFKTDRPRTIHTVALVTDGMAGDNEVKRE